MFRKGSRGWEERESFKRTMEAGENGSKGKLFELMVHYIEYNNICGDLGSSPVDRMEEA
jgi:hypothetical protein